MESKFGREIGHRFLQNRADPVFPIRVLAGEIFLEGVVNLFQLTQKSFVGSEFFQPGLARKLEHANGIVIGPVPKLGIEMTKQAPGGRLPRPPDVETDFAQGLEGGGKSGDDIIGLKIRHGGNGLTVLSRKGKKVSSDRWQRVTCRGRREAPGYRLSGSRGAGSHVKGSASRGRWSSLFANGEGEALGKDGFCRHQQPEKESGEEATEMG